MQILTNNLTLASARRKAKVFLSVILTLGFLALSGGGVQAAKLDKPTIGTAVAGKHYQVLPKFGKTKVPPGKVEVIEFFWYGCPHCYRLDPYIESWLKNKPSYVTFRRVAVPSNGLWEVHARTYYTADRLKLLGKTHVAFFDAIHKQRQPLTNQRTISKFFSNYGVSVEQFNDVYNSFAVESKIRLASREARSYKVNSVPVVIVNGKYMLTAGWVGGEANLIAVINQLAKLEHENPRPASDKSKS